MNMVLQRFGPEPTVAVSPDAIRLRDQALATAKEVVAVTSSDEQEKAVLALRDLKGLLASTESDRKAIKAPVLVLTDLIDETAKAHVAPIKLEVMRLEEQLAKFQVAERKRFEAAQAERLAKEREIERKRQEEEAAARRREEEAAAKARAETEKAEAAKLKARTEAGRAEADRRAAEAARKLAEVEKEVAAARAKAVVEAEISKAAAVRAVADAVPARAEGMVIREVWKYEVFDPELIHKARPDLVRIEPIPSAINAAIRDGMRKCPGMLIFPETLAGVRI